MCLRANCAFQSALFLGEAHRIALALSDYPCLVADPKKHFVDHEALTQ